MRKLFTLALMLGAIITLVACTASNNEFEDTRIQMDINPSVEILTDARGRVSYVTPLNEDAAVLLLDTELEGKLAMDAMLEITDLAIQAGYITQTQTNAMVIHTDNENEAVRTALQSKIQTAIKSHVESKNMNIDLINGNNSVTQADRDMALELGVTVGKYMIIKAAMAIDLELTYETAIEMSVRDLIAIIKDNRETLKDLVSEEARGLFLQLKANAMAGFKFMRANYIYLRAEVALITNPGLFDDVLVDSTLSATEAVALYKAYVDALDAIEPIDASSYETAVQANIDADADIQLLIEALDQAKIDLEAIHDEYTGQTPRRDDLQTDALLALEAYVQAKADLHAAIEVYVEAENIPYDYHFFYQNDQVRIIIRTNYMDEFRVVTETYRQLFLEAGIDLEAFENLFNLGSELQNMLGEIEQNVLKFRSQMQNLNLDMQLEIRYEHTIRFNQENSGQNESNKNTN